MLFPVIKGFQNLIIISQLYHFGELFFSLGLFHDWFCILRMGEDHIHLDDRKQGIELPQLPLLFPPPCGKFGFVLKREKSLDCSMSGIFQLDLCQP